MNACPGVRGGDNGERNRSQLLKINGATSVIYDNVKNPGLMWVRRMLERVHIPRSD